MNKYLTELYPILRGLTWLLVTSYNCIITYTLIVFCNNGTNYVIQKSLCHEEEPINQVMKKVYNKQIKCRGGVIGYMKRRQNLIILAVNMSINYTRRI